MEDMVHYFLAVTWIRVHRGVSSPGIKSTTSADAARDMESTAIWKSHVGYCIGVFMFHWVPWIQLEFMVPAD